MAARVGFGSSFPLLAKERESRLPEVEPTKTGGKPTADRCRGFAVAATEGHLSLTPGSPTHMFAICSSRDGGRGALVG
jgi:hypothetical protein